MKGPGCFLKSRESRGGCPGVVDSDIKVPVATEVWGRGQTLKGSHYFVRATCKQEEIKTLRRVDKSIKTK